MHPWCNCGHLLPPLGPLPVARRRIIPWREPSPRPLPSWRHSRGALPAMARNHQQNGWFLRRIGGVPRVSKPKNGWFHLVFNFGMVFSFLVPRFRAFLLSVGPRFSARKGAPWFDSKTEDHLWGCLLVYSPEKTDRVGLVGAISGKIGQSDWNACIWVILGICSPKNQYHTDGMRVFLLCAFVTTSNHKLVTRWAPDELAPPNSVASKGPE